MADVNVASRPFWFPDIKGFLALAIILVVATLAFLLLTGVVIDKGMEQAFTYLLGILTACLKDVYQYFFGSSSGSSKKDDVMVSAFSAKPSGAPPAAIIAAITILVAAATFSSAPSAHASDVLHAPKLAGITLPAAAPCTLVNCTGGYAGFNLMGTATNANVLANGINGSVAGGGQSIGVQAGYQFWNGTWFFGPEVGAEYTYGGTIVPTLGIPKWMTYEIIKFGAPLSTFFGGITPANQTGLPALLANNTISPYLFVGAAQRNWGTGIASGGGVIFLIPDLAATATSPASGHWFLDARYTNIQYTSGNSVAAGVSVPQENLLSVGLNFKF